MGFDSTISYHKKTPDITVDQHVRKNQIELSSYVSKHKTIYLDTNFWITLRKVKTGELKDSVSLKYYELVKLLVEEKNYIFPISENSFAEILKSESSTLDQFVILIDELSKGISILSYDDRVRMELMYFVYSTLGQSTYLPNEIVWTKLPYSFGYFDPINDKIDPSLDTLLRKSFFDLMWKASLSSIVTDLKKRRKLVQTPFLDCSSKLNEGKFLHAHENKSFKQMFLSELAGLLDANKPIIHEAMIRIFENEVSFKASNKDIELSKKSSLLVNMIYNIFRLNKINKELPSYRITSGLYAAIRWDKKQKFHKNDVIDIGHASAALPYCDYYFSERKFAHLITQKQMSYDKIYDCQVCHSVKSAVEVLNELYG